MIRLKPFRADDEHDVINLFALSGTTGDEGNFVKIIGSGALLDDLWRDINLTTEANIVSQYRVLKPSIILAASGDNKGDVLGIIRKNVRTVDYLGRNLLYDDTRKTEMNAVLSGEANPVVTKGLFLVSGIEGLVEPGKGVGVSNTVAGGWKSETYDGATSLGIVLSTLDGDGYALVKIDCN